MRAYEVKHKVIHILPISSSFSCRPFPLFDRAAGFPSPRPQDAEAGARRACQGWPLFSGHPKGSALTRPSTTARWFGRGLGAMYSS